HEAHRHCDLALLHLSSHRLEGVVVGTCEGRAGQAGGDRKCCGGQDEFPGHIELLIGRCSAVPPCGARSRMNLSASESSRRGYLLNGECQTRGGRNGGLLV